MQDNDTYQYDPVIKRLTWKSLSYFPREIFELEDIEILDLSFGHLSTLPQELNRLKKLRVAFFSNNDFTHIPEALSQCESLEMVGFKSCKIGSIPDNTLPLGLRGLILTDNQIKTLPKSIGKYSKLQKLMLAGNKLRDIPEEILDCKNLELLRIPVNNISSSTEWLFQLPRLGWFNDGNNPYTKNTPAPIQQKEISWNDISMGKKIGESPKNIVYKARLTSGEEVAVKIYGEGITADGDTRDDINITLHVGSHPNVIGATATILNIPDNKMGIVMPLISTDYTKLGNPPSLTTLTRDVYPGKSFSAEQITSIPRDIASAMSYCHAKGIMHGDIYAHNVLTNEKGKSYIGDFGAATLYQPGSDEGALREKVDVKGFGYLIEDLLLHTPNGSSASTEIQNLQNSCLNEKIIDRPTFNEISNILA